MARYLMLSYLPVLAAMSLACANPGVQNEDYPTEFAPDEDYPTEFPPIDQVEPRPPVRPPRPAQPPEWCWATRDAPECRGYERPQTSDQGPDIHISDSVPLSCRMFLIGCPDRPPHCVWFRDWHMNMHTGDFVDWRSGPYRVCVADSQSVPATDVPHPRYAGGRAYPIADSLQTRCHRCRTLARECRNINDQQEIALCTEDWLTCFAEAGGTCSPPDRDSQPDAGP